MKMGLPELQYESYHNNCLQTPIFFIDEIMFRNWQDINPMGLSAPWADYKNKKIFTNMKIL